MVDYFTQYLVNFLKNYGVCLVFSDLTGIEDETSLLKFFKKKRINGKGINTYDFFTKLSILFDLKREGIYLYDPNYKNSKNYVKVKDRLLFTSNGSINMEEFIERYLLTENEVLDTYESIYDMGNPYELYDEDCEYTALAKEIIKTGLVVVVKAIDLDAEAEEFVKKFDRPGGLKERLRNFLNLDLDLFDNEVLRNKCENAKILFFFYMLEKKYFPKTNVLMLLNNPSMENIDNSYLGMETYNRDIIKFIKNSLEKELSLPEKKKIKNTMQSIVSEWDNFLSDTLLKANYMAGLWYEYGFEKKIALFFLQPVPEKFIIKNKVAKYSHSPIETLYLKVLQHEYLGQITDILKVNLNQMDINCDKRLMFIEEMKQLHERPVDINCIEKYIDDNIFEIAKYVYLKSKTTRDERNRILNSKEKVRRWLDFCIRARPLINVKDILTELLIISCLQAILDDKKDTFDYAFPLYQKYMKHIPTAQAVLKNNERTLDAVQIYWVRKVMDYWYANIGRYNVRIKFRDLENVCDVILTKILSCPNCDEMLEMHEYYFRKINDALTLKKDEIDVVRDFEEHLNNRGFKYVDDDNKIRDAFLCPAEIKGTYDSLIFLIDDTLNNNDSELHITLEAHTTNLEELIKLDFKLLFDYKTKLCVISEFKKYIV